MAWRTRGQSLGQSQPLEMDGWIPEKKDPKMGEGTSCSVYKLHSSSDWSLNLKWTWTSHVISHGGESKQSN